MKKFLLLAALAVTASSYAATPTVDPSTVMPREWTSFRLERVTFLRSHPQLSAQEKALNEQIKAQQAKVEAAMVKADPKVAPILARLDVLLKKGWKDSSLTPLSTSDWQQLRSARAAAFQANPDLVAANKQLLKQKKALGNKIDAALIKEDPSAAGFISKWPTDS